MHREGLSAIGKWVRRLLLLSLILMAFHFDSFTQFYNGSQMNFGKNRVQYKEFLWTFYKFEKYDIYFYLGGKELALYTAEYAEQVLDEVEDKLDTGLDDKIQFIVFNNLTDLKQSNIGLIQNERYNTGGVTHIIGKKVFLYFDGSHENFDQQIRAGIAQSIVNQLLYGSSIGSQIKNTSLFPFPDWYMNGLVSMISEDWSTTIDNYVRDGIISGRFDKFNQLTGDEARYAGHAFWRYIAKKYGESSISNIIYMAKVSRRLESGFLYILGISFKNLQKEALDYYRERYSQFENSREFPEESVLKKVKKDFVYNRMRLSPDGNKIAYTYNRAGQYKVFMKDLNTGRKKKLMKAGFRLEEKIDYSYPLLAWHPTGRILAILVERKGEIYMYYYLLDEKKFERVILFQFEKVLDMAYSDDGLSLVMSAVQRGQSDIFVYDIGSNSYTQITKDHYDDLYPRFIDNSGKIIFSSNRISDTIRFDEEYDPGKIQKRYDLFLYNFKNPDNVMRRVTETPLVNEIQPMEYENNYITYLSDKNGIYNRFIGRFDSAISFIDTTTHYRYYTRSFPITDYPRNILDQDVVPETFKFAQIIYKDEKYRMQVYDMVPPESHIPVKLENTLYMEELVNLFGQVKEQGEGEELKQGVIKSQKQRGFSTVRQSEALQEIISEDSIKEGEKIDINNYQFKRQDFITTDKNWKYTLLDVPLPGQKKDEKEEPPKRLNYNVEYFINEIVTQIDFSFLNQMYQPFTGGSSPIFLNPGFNALFKIGVTDLLEDYRITGGVRLNLNLSNNEYLFSYANLRKRLDKEIVFHRQSIENYGDYNNIIRVYSHELFYVASWPFNEVMAIKGTASYRNEMGVYLSTDAFNLARPNEFRNWVGAKGEFIFDNTKDLGLNLYYGTRFKIFGEYYELVDQRGQNLAVLGFDFRNYQRIHRVFIWANRFATSTSLGNNKLIYYMGGVDNWLFPRFNQNTPIDREQNYAYQTLATNMRGFDQNIRNGNSFAVFNSELRFPVFRYFAKHPIKSDFLNNFQVVGFGDVGTAWTGLQPFSDDNYLYTRVVRQSPLNITVKVQKEPIVGGFGFGARTRLLGYFIRADLAWGVEDMEVQPSVFYFSLSLDF
ncbi:MAG: PD40 domain-containing protein [Bacteroidales bacterium]|nr:PD40 domain-containing protein [Bacteroidales bacterium]